MALRTYTRISDGQKVTIDDTYLTASMMKRLGNPEAPEIPVAIKTKLNKPK